MHNIIRSLFLAVSLISFAAAQPTPVRMCVSPDAMPIEKIDQGKHIGLASDFMKLIGERSGYEFVLVPTQSWSESLSYITENRCDILSAAESNKALSKHLLFTEPYMRFPIVIAAREGTPLISSLETIKHKKVATLADGEHIPALRALYPKMQIIEVTSTYEGLKALLSGEFDYFLDITADLGYVMRRYGMDGVTIAGYTGMDFRYRVAVRKGEEVLFEHIKSAIKSISEQEKNVLLKKWIDVKINKAPDYSLLWTMMAVSLVIILLLFIRNRRLDHEVSKRERIQNELEGLNNTLQERVASDVEKIRQQDALLQHQSRLAQMGELLQNISHQWRQPLSRLSSMIMHAQLKQKNLSLSPEEIEKHFSQSNSILEHMSQTIDDFSDFFEKDTISSEPFALSESCQNAFEIIGGSLKSAGISYHTDLSNDTQKIPGQSRALSHVILILLSNAKDALITAAKSNPSIWITEHEEDNHVVITVEDNAGGVDEEVVPKIFDPYFTTKPKYKGTGMGLYMAKSIIHQVFQGEITVESSEQGSRFSIILPIK